MTLSDADFRRLGEFIQTECGIKMPPSKKVMLTARLQKRLRSLGMTSFEDYCDYLFSPQGFENELVHMIDVITTNKTDFFRGPGQFEYLSQTGLKELVDTLGAGVKRKLRVWSAGCSTGEEPYTLAMVLKDFADSYPAFHFSILATDICTQALEKAATAIYSHDKVESVPMALRRKYLLKSKEKRKNLVRIVPELRVLVRFGRINLMDDDFGLSEPMDIIFCRNVIIYFDRPTQEKLLNRLCHHLVKGGYLFLGQSETLSGLRVPLIHVNTTIYKKP